MCIIIFGICNYAYIILSEVVIFVIAFFISSIQRFRDVNETRKSYSPEDSIRSLQVARFDLHVCAIIHSYGKSIDVGKVCGETFVRAYDDPFLAIETRILGQRMDADGRAHW